jgi:hypothetical protein
MDYLVWYRITHTDHPWFGRFTGRCWVIIRLVAPLFKHLLIYCLLTNVYRYTYLDYVCIYLLLKVTPIVLVLSDPTQPRRYDE